MDKQRVNQSITNDTDPFIYNYFMTEGCEQGIIK